MAERNNEMRGKFIGHQDRREKDIQTSVDVWSIIPHTHGLNDFQGIPTISHAEAHVQPRFMHDARVAQNLPIHNPMMQGTTNFGQPTTTNIQPFIVGDNSSLKRKRSQDTTQAIGNHVSTPNVPLIQNPTMPCLDFCSMRQGREFYGKYWNGIEQLSTPSLPSNNNQEFWNNVDQAQFQQNFMPNFAMQTSGNMTTSPFPTLLQDNLMTQNLPTNNPTMPNQDFGRMQPRNFGGGNEFERISTHGLASTLRQQLSNLESHLLGEVTPNVGQQTSVTAVVSTSTIPAMNSSIPVSTDEMRFEQRRSQKGKNVVVEEESFDVQRFLNDNPHETTDVPKSSLAGNLPRDSPRSNPRSSSRTTNPRSSTRRNPRGARRRNVQRNSAPHDRPEDDDVVPFEEDSSLRTKSALRCCHFSGSGKLLAAVGDDSKVLIWDLDSKDQKNVNVIEEDSNFITDVRFKANSSIFATSSFDKHVRLYDALQMGKSNVVLSGHTEVVTSVDFHTSQTNTLFSCDRSNEIRVWDVDQSYCVGSFKGGNNQVRYQPRFGNYLAAASGNVINLIDSRNQKIEHRLEGHVNDVRSICWDHSGRYLASVSDDCARIWTVLNHKKPVHYLKSVENNFISCALSPVYSLVMPIGSYKSIIIWNPVDGGKTWTYPAHDSIVSALTHTHATHRIASVGHDSCIKLWKQKSYFEMLRSG